MEKPKLVLCDVSDVEINTSQQFSVGSDRQQTPE